MALASGREQLERVLPHLTHWGGAVEETGELLWDLPVLPLCRVLAPAAAAPPVVLEWTERQRNKKLNVAKINKVPMQRACGRAEEFKNGGKREAGWAGERAEGEKKRGEGRKQFCIVLNVQFVPEVGALMKFQTLA